ncbi:MAG UNVERIFIED_CONTAM: 23S rRNA (guanosine(2251)-2'-O)-methyltransferase RlmB [Rickettsiaceae bacterium]|jgi:23S rRNA (guanosine2251-2'-O)-methyltransferase
MSKTYIIYGKHAIEAAIKNSKRKIQEILCTKQNFESIRKISNKLPIKIVEKDKIQSLLPLNAPSQNLIAMLEPITLYHIPREIIEKPDAKLVILDQITDPQNLGAIMRSAAAFNIDAIIYPKDGNVKENGIVAKAACGALDIVPLIEIVNVSTAILELKKHGFWAIGLDGEAKDTIGKIPKLLQGKVIIVMGSEGEGIRPLVKKNCDLLAKIPNERQNGELKCIGCCIYRFL